MMLCADPDGNSRFSTMILLPLRSTSLMHKNPKGGKIIHGMHPVGPKERLSDFLAEYLVRVISVAVV